MFKRKKRKHKYILVFNIVIGDSEEFILFYSVTQFRLVNKMFFNKIDQM